jgi:hypothetical protein
MAFLYESLKQITNEGIIDTTLVGTDFASNSVTATTILDGTVTGAKIGNQQITTAKFAATTVPASAMAASSVVLDSTAVTGTLPIAKGGTGLATATANTTLMVNNAGTALEYAYGGTISVNVYTASGTWTRPTNCTRVRVQVVGSGGGGSGHGEAGGAGGYTEGYLDVTAITSVAVTINGAGGGVNYHNIAGAGGACSFGAYFSSSGGEAARNVGGHTGGRPGIGSGGTVNLYGGGGSGHTHGGAGAGGRSYFGGSSIGVHHNSPHTYDWEARGSPGAGGVGADRNHGRGGNGQNGTVIVWNLR